MAVEDFRRHRPWTGPRATFSGRKRVRGRRWASWAARRLARQATVAVVLSGLLVVLAMERQWRSPQAAAPPPATAAPLSGYPAITDGDTIRLGDVRVRFAGVDAPEMSTAAGRRAKTHLAAIIGGGGVRCDDTGERSYDRIVALCFTASGRELAAAMVEDGWALDLPRYSGGRYGALERQAQAAGRGMHAGGVG